METCGTPRVLVPTCGGVQKKFTFRRKSSTEKILENIATFTVQLCITPHQIYNRGNAFGCIINNLMGT